MTPEHKAEPKSVDAMNREISEKISYEVNKAREEGIKIGLAASKSNFIEKLVEEIDRLNSQQAQHTLPSRIEALLACSDPTNDNYESGWLHCYDWLTTRMSPVANNATTERPEVSDDDLVQRYRSWSSTVDPFGVADPDLSSYIAGYRAALDKK